MAVHQISEYGRIKSEGDKSSLRKNDIRIPKKSFNNLWDFILEEQSNNDSSAKAFYEEIEIKSNNKNKNLIIFIPYQYLALCVKDFHLNLYFN